MPQNIVCSKCGAQLYNGLELESPTEIIQRNGGFCPKCRGELDFKIDNVKIVPTESAK